jgi:hypothetical protein
VAPKDALRFAYTAPRPVFLTVLSVDPMNAVSVYYASKETSPEPAGREIAVEASTILDETIGRETIYGALCKRFVDPSALEEAIRRAEPEDDCTIVQIPIEKRGAR